MNTIADLERVQAQAVDLSDFDTANSAAAELARERPDFNGLGARVFLAGTEVLSTIESLSAAERLNLAPHLLEHLRLTFLGDDLSPEQYKELSGFFAEQATKLAETADHDTSHEAWLASVRADPIE